MREADRACVRVLAGAVLERAAAEHLGARLEVAVHLEPADELPITHRNLSGTTSKPIACSSAWPTRKSVFSPNWGPINWSPTGMPSESPHGMLSPGSPAMQDGIVSRSERYIAMGSAVRAPSGNATVGDVGETSASNVSNSASCSCLITVRTFCAW